MEEEFCSEYLDFAVETYRHASRYGDSPCDCHFLPRRGVFFWPMQKSDFDQRRFRLWTRVLSRMIKDNILIPVLDPAGNGDFRDAHYLFHHSYFRPPYHKAEKIYWPHVKEWYFEYMNNQNESALLNEAMNRLEIYLDGRDRKESKEKKDRVNEERKVSGQFKTRQSFFKPRGSPNITRFPYADRSSYKPHSQAPLRDSKPDRTTRNSDHILTQLRFSDSDNTSSFGSNPKLRSSSTPVVTDESRPLARIPEPTSPGYNKCRGCLRCAHCSDYPDDLFEGRIILGLNDDTLPRDRCDYIICLECKQIFDHLQTDSFKFHLDSPEHTAKVLSRLQMVGKPPSVTSSTQRRVENLEKFVVERGYAGLADYISKVPHLSYSSEKRNSSPIGLKASQASDNPKHISHHNTADRVLGGETFTKACTQNIPGADCYIDASDEHESDNPSNNDIQRQLGLLRIQQRKLDSRLETVETGIKAAQTMVKDLGYQVETGANRTQALVRSFIRHDDAIKLLQKDAIQGKAIADIMEGAIDAMNGSTKSEAVADRLDRLQMELDGVRKGLQNKVEDLSTWLKVVDRHTNEILSLKQKVWINGQINNPSDSSRFLVQKLEHRMQIQQEATRSFMLKTEQRFEAMVRQYSEEINSLKKSDEDKQRKIINLTAQAGLKFAHLEQKAASLRKSRK